MTFSRRLGLRSRLPGTLTISLQLACWACALPQSTVAQKEKPAACISQNLARLVVTEKNGVRVRPPEQGAPDGGGRENARAAQMALEAKTSRERAEARKWFEKGARKGSPAAQVNLAVASLAGWGGETNAGTALYWLTLAAERRYAPAYFDLGVLYFKGCGVRQDYQQAFQYFAAGAKGGDLGAQVNLAYFYNNGLGTKKDDAAAAMWYRRAAEGRDAQAQFALGDMTLRGEGVAQDEAAAFAWFERSALQGHALGRLMLGSMFATGRGVAKDPQAAYMWLSAAELSGEPRAKARLAQLEKQLTATQVAEAKLRAKSIGATAHPVGEVAALH